MVVICTTSMCIYRIKMMTRTDTRMKTKVEPGEEDEERREQAAED